jgi:hypothetical protein
LLKRRSSLEPTEIDSSELNDDDLEAPTSAEITALLPRG